GEESERRELYDYSDGEMHDRTGVRRRADGPGWGAIVNDIMKFWDEMAPKYTVIIALRYYDELSHDRVAKLTGTSAGVSNVTVNRWRAHARNQVRLGDDFEESEHLKPSPWEPPELLNIYIRDR